MTTFYDVIQIIGLFVHVLGLLLFGVTAGWFTLHIIGFPEKNWQLISIVFSVFLVFIALLVRYLTPGSFGAFLIGVAGAMIFWGMIKPKEKTEKKK
jgi:Kef-type K+ transport system membrane component KefB